MDMSHIITEIVILICGGFCSFAVFKMKKRDDQKEKEALRQQIKQQKEELQKEKERQAILEALDNISGRLKQIEDDQNDFHGKLEELIVKNQKLEEVNVATIRDRLLQAFRYFIEKDKAPALARENIDMMIKAYEGLGGNGFVHDMYEQFKKLPLDQKSMC